MRLHQTVPYATVANLRDPPPRIGTKQMMMGGKARPLNPLHHPLSIGDINFLSL
ncbi:MAG: hypothetical protein NW237_07225 [Cyanobacteriota bacterium]|nr:hypothetical protein [Cyanobacteriota bacterium]